jgi:hypothetical protein
VLVIEIADVVVDENDIVLCPPAEIHAEPVLGDEELLLLTLLCVCNVPFL